MLCKFLTYAKNFTNQLINSIYGMLKSMEFTYANYILPFSKLRWNLCAQNYPNSSAALGLATF